MKLGEALSKLKKERSKLARLIQLRKDHVYVEVGKQPAFDPKKISQEIEEQIETIRQLKIQVQRTNLATSIKGEDISLAEAIIKVNDIRSRIAHLSKVFEGKSSWLYRERDQKEKVALLDEQEIEDELEKLEIAKVQLDNRIQMTNWTTNVLD